MRTDDRAFKLEERARETSMFTFDMGRFGGTAVGASQSGKERNRLFANEQVGDREEFVEVSGISGLDSIGDGRSFVVWDFDRDGWPDVALTGANSPLLQIFHNELPLASAGAAEKGKFIAVRLRGGNRTSHPTDDWSPLDAFGAKLSLHLDDITVVRELRCGEGLAAQNSSTLVIGIGERDSVGTLDVRWPSGRVDTIEDVVAGTLVTLYENPTHSPTGSIDVRESYLEDRVQVPNEIANTDEVETLALVSGGEAAPALTMYTTMATTCVACNEELSDLAELRAALTSDELAMYGVPTARWGGVDGTNDDAATLSAWVDARSPAYELLIDISSDQVETVTKLVKRTMNYDGYSATIVTDRAGRVVFYRQGAPTLSELRKLLREQ